MVDDAESVLSESGQLRSQLALSLAKRSVLIKKRSRQTSEERSGAERLQRRHVPVTC